MVARSVPLDKRRRRIESLPGYYIPSHAMYKGGG